MSERTDRDWKVGDLVQIDPAHDPCFAACVLIVTEVKGFGVQGCVRVPGADGPTEAYYRLPWHAGEKVGTAEWVPSRDDEGAS